MNQTTIATKAGTFEVSEHQGKVIVSKNGKKLATLPEIDFWNKDAIVKAIEQNGKQLNKLAGKASTTEELTPENILPTLTGIYDLLNSTIEDKQTKGFVTSRLKQVINKLAA